jgi:hypothetical protein
MDFSRPVSIERLDGRKLRVHFADGKEGVVDFAPETLYHDATGIPLPAWMER